MTLRTAALQDGRSLAAGLYPGQDVDQVEYLVRFGYDPPPLDRISDEPPLEAAVNHGVWIARCPCGRFADGTLGGSVVWLDQPLMWCSLCRPSVWRRVTLPAEAERIARLLELRPTEAQNYEPGETLAALARQNAEHGLPYGLEGG